MALFTDSDIVTSEDLQQVDSEALAAAKATKPLILVDGPGSVCEQAWLECGQRLMAAMQMYSSYLMQPGMSGGHLAAVLNTGIPSRTQARVRLQQIVTTESQYGNARSALELWVTYKALSLLFRNASSRQGQDRYQEKFERYEGEADFWWMQLRNNGLPFIWQPLEAPGAKHGFKPGAWAQSNVTAASQAGTMGGDFRVAITYCDATRGYVSQSSTGNAESAPSDVFKVTTAPDQAVHVDISSLNPPNGQPDPVGLSQGMWTPLTATHWNLWVGSAQDDSPLYLQRELIPIGTKTVTLAADPTLSGSTMGNGQYPDLNLVFMNLVMRG